MENSTINREMEMDAFLKERQQEVMEMAREIAEKEFDILQLNLFLSSIGKKEFDKASQSIKDIREMDSRREINLEEFDSLIDEI